MAHTELPAFDLGIAEAAQVVGLHPITLRKLCEEGKGPPFQRLPTPGGGHSHRRFNREQLIEWAASFVQTPASSA